MADSKEGSTEESKDGSTEDSKKDTLKWISLIISILALTISISALIYSSLPFGEVRPIEPSAYGIIRGERDLPDVNKPPITPSDNLFLDIEWINNCGQSVLIKEPKLVLIPKVTNDPNKTSIITFEMAGEYDGFKQGFISQEFIRKKSIVLAPHSISDHTLIFHIEHWSEKENPAYYFKFYGDEHYEMKIQYNEIRPGIPIIWENLLTPKECELKQEFQIYPYTDQLVTENGPWYTYYYF